MARTIYTQTAQSALDNALEDLRILAGDIVGPSGASWQDVAGTTSVNLRCVAAYLDQCREGGPFATMLEVKEIDNA